MKLKYERNAFPLAKEVQWADVIESINIDFQMGCKEAKYSETHAPTFVLFNGVFPGTIGPAVKEVQEKAGGTAMHTFLSLGKGAPTYGDHKDTMDVLLVQAIGTTGYRINQGDTFWLEPGDALWIPAGVWHDPQIIGPRVTMSFDFDH